MITICKCGSTALGKMGYWPNEYLTFKCDSCGLVFTEYERNDRDRSKDGHLMKTKQVIVMRKDLNMRKGKMIAQGSHASLGVFTKNMIYNCSDVAFSVFFYNKSWVVTDWLNNSFVKIVVYVSSEKELIELENKAREMDVLNCLITDNGDTEFGGISTKTCIAIGPDESVIIDKITGHLPIL